MVDDVVAFPRKEGSVNGGVKEVAAFTGADVVGDDGQGTAEEEGVGGGFELLVLLDGHLVAPLALAKHRQGFLERGEVAVAVGLRCVFAMRHFDQITFGIVGFVLIAVVNVVARLDWTTKVSSGGGAMGVSFSVAHNDISGLSAYGFEPYTIMPHPPECRYWELPAQPGHPIVQSCRNP